MLLYYTNLTSGNQILNYVYGGKMSQEKSTIFWEVIVSVIQGLLGRAIAEAVTRWLHTAAARVQSRVWSSGICG
jgi:hypothetical protein